MHVHRYTYSTDDIWYKFEIKWMFNISDIYTTHQRRIKFEEKIILEKKVLICDQSETLLNNYLCKFSMSWKKNTTSTSKPYKVFSNETLWFHGN